MNTINTTGYAFDESELDYLIDYCRLEGAALEFADACCNSNTVEELRAALADGVEHYSCEPDCAQWGMDEDEWLAGLRGALAWKLHNA